MTVPSVLLEDELVILLAVPVQNENAGLFVQKLLRFSNQPSQNIESRVWPGANAQAGNHEASPLLVQLIFLPKDWI